LKAGYYDLNKTTNNMSTSNNSTNNNTTNITSEEIYNQILPVFKKTLDIEGAVDRYKQAALVMWLNYRLKNTDRTT
jgi:hypothetical protein